MDEPIERDPVSGNEVPFGADPENVRDDIPIMASEGEYVIPANVVRFLGVEKIEKMVNKAKEALEAMGEIVDEEEEEDALPFDPNELSVIEPEGEFPDDAALQKFAEGGVVEGGASVLPQGQGFTGVKQYKGKDGQIMFIPYMNGEPLFDIPSGYVESDPTAVGVTAPNPSHNITRTSTGPQESSAKETGAFVEENRSNLSRHPNTWTVEDFVDFGKSRGSVAETAMKGIIGAMPLGNLAYKSREKWLDNQVAEMFDNMITTGIDPQGNPIAPADMTRLTATRDHLSQRLSQDTGLPLDPTNGLLDNIQRFANFISGGRGDQSVGAPASSLSPEGTAMVQGRSPSSSTNAGDNGAPGSSYGGGNYGVGSDIGRDPNDGPSSGSMASGGLYNKGGLVTRRKAKGMC